MWKPRWNVTSKPSNTLPSGTQEIAAFTAPTMCSAAGTLRLARCASRNGAERRPPSRKHRSEEHTSELQSLRHLVCRLLLEKKKNKRQNASPFSSPVLEELLHLLSCALGPGLLRCTTRTPSVMSPPPPSVSFSFFF